MKGTRDIDTALTICSQEEGVDRFGLWSKSVHVDLIEF